MIQEEHGINIDGSINLENPPKGKLSTYFLESSKNTYHGRAIFFDLDYKVIDDMKSKPIAKSFSPDNFICGKESSGGNWGEGYYGKGTEIIDQSLEAIREQTELCDRFEGFEITNSIIGGTGSGFGSLLIGKIREEYPDKIFETHTIFPPSMFSDNVIGLYNSVLSMHHLVENTDSVSVLTNDSLFRIASENFKIFEATYEDINPFICQVMSSVTSCYRFPGIINSNMRKMATNLIPFPRLHFFLNIFAPLKQSKKKLTEEKLIKHAFDSRNLLCNIDINSAKFFSIAGIFRGFISSSIIEKAILEKTNPLHMG